MQGELFSTFKQLHYADTPLVLVNIWDAGGAVLVQAAGAKALATGSASLAWSLGYADGNQLPTEELLNAVGRILRVSRVPLTIDIEEGYSESPEQVADLVARLQAMGVAGINLEDGTNAPTLLAGKIQAIRHKVGESMYINARTDVYLRGLAEGQTALDMAIERLRLYQEAGADGGFIPGLQDAATARQLAASLSIPLNLMVASSEPIEALAQAGIRRFSMGPVPFVKAYQQLVNLQDAAYPALNYPTINGLF
ncbi:isocitrate lyase/PEP mutase family protein [Bowmanella yangjiangensis]|uniref:Isocitrate lyase/phosphoenolpyruvate mutase family protein n=1 Tax=Bowmanella yangjiangensis TaxID=2811230 RepID=A0ABS3CUQ1_9ALTE|nr:isocitrate lyase/phosphoenolpyruvate mutase family protein [Bowmanella yangjiangensis]MBN7820842.1 isocitrate lyase/phosphoenolpyruvate mutase family protein [Bowmanella yangjiangensis]